MRCLECLGERVGARDFEHQVAERRIRAELLNRFTQLGTLQMVRLAKIRTGDRKGLPSSSFMQ